MLQRECSRCGETKPIDRFKVYKRKNSPLTARTCKDCENKDAKERYQANPEKYRESGRTYSRRYRENNPEKSKESLRVYRLTHPDAIKNRRRRVWLRQGYGITLEEYQRMFAAQGGVCAICAEPETSTYRGKVRELGVDHCHITGKVRGLLCSQCNVAIGKLRDDPALIRNALAYVLKHKSVAA